MTSFILSCVLVGAVFLALDVKHFGSGLVSSWLVIVGWFWWKVPWKAH